MALLNKNYLTISAWMITDLDLSGSELLTYSIIYSFCQDGTAKQISLNYFASWLKGIYRNEYKSLSKRRIIAILQSLQNKKLISIKKNFGKPSSYSINEDKLVEAVTNATRRDSRNVVPTQPVNKKHLSELVQETVRKNSIQTSDAESEKTLSLEEFNELASNLGI